MEQRIEEKLDWIIEALQTIPEVGKLLSEKLLEKKIAQRTKEVEEFNAKREKSIRNTLVGILAFPEKSMEFKDILEAFSKIDYFYSGMAPFIRRDKEEKARILAQEIIADTSKYPIFHTHILEKYGEPLVLEKEIEKVRNGKS